MAWFRTRPLSLEDDAAVTDRVLSAQDGPTVLVGHSYGGAVITEAGTHENVPALVYITAFAPDKGESVNTLIADPPPGAPPILPPQDGFCSSPATNSRRRLPGTSRAKTLSSWPTPRSLGASKR